MLITIITLIAVATNLYADFLLLNPPDKFIEIDPILIKQPVKRIFVPKDSSLGKISFTLNEQITNEPFDQYIAKTSEYVESKLNVLLQPIGIATSKKGYPFKLYSVIQKKDDYDLQILQAYLHLEKTLYVLSYNAPKTVFTKYLSLFQTFLEEIEKVKNPLKANLEKEIFDLIKKDAITFEKFLQSKSIAQFGKKIWNDLPEDHLISRLFELRIHCYE